MTEVNRGFVWTIDHCYPLLKTDLSSEKKMNKSTYWINLRPMYKNKNCSTGSKIDHQLYLMEEIKANQFKKLKKDQAG